MDRLLAAASCPRGDPQAFRSWEQGSIVGVRPAAGGYHGGLEPLSEDGSGAKAKGTIDQTNDVAS